MEFEDLDEKVQWEARRVAAAFGVTAFRQVPFYGAGTRMQFSADTGDGVLVWQLEGGELRYLALSDHEERKEMQLFLDNLLPNRIPYQNELSWIVEPNPNPKYNEQMGHALYRLGIEWEGELVELDYPLSAHQKLELRLSMPREFWPKTWLDEEGERCDANRTTSAAPSLNN